MSSSTAHPDAPYAVPTTPAIGVDRIRGRHRAGHAPESTITALLRDHPRGVPYERRRHRPRSAWTAIPTPPRRPVTIRFAGVDDTYAHTGTG